MSLEFTSCQELIINTNIGKNKIKLDDNKSKHKKSVTVPTQKIKKNKKRSFIGIYVDLDDDIIVSGKFKGIKPMQAAKKVFSKIYNMHKKDNDTFDSKIIFGIGELSTTINKVFVYSGINKKVNDGNPNIIKRKKGDKINEIKYFNSHKVKSLKYSECPDFIDKCEDAGKIKKCKRGRRNIYNVIINNDNDEED